MYKYKNSIILIAVALALAVLVSPFASSYPDGLEWVASVKGFLSKADESVFWKMSLMPDYKVLFLKNEKLSTSMAGLLGTLACFAIAIVLFRSFGKRTDEDNAN